MAASCPRKRIHTICRSGRSVAEPRYLAVVSRHANSAQVRHIRPMAANGLWAVYPGAWGAGFCISEGEWGMGSREWGVGMKRSSFYSPFPTPHSPVSDPEGLTPIGQDHRRDGEDDLALLVAALHGARQQAAFGARLHVDLLDQPHAIGDGVA